MLKQYWGWPGAGPALAADGAPVQDHAVAGGNLGDVRAHGADNAGGLVAEQEREVVVDAALLVVQVGVADAAGEDVHEGLAGAGVRHQDGLQGDVGILGTDYCAFDFMDHGKAPLL